MNFDDVDLGKKDYYVKGCNGTCANYGWKCLSCCKYNSYNNSCGRYSLFSDTHVKYTVDRL